MSKRGGQVEGMGPHGGGVEGEAEEEPWRVERASVAGWEGMRRIEKAKVSEEALLTRSSKARKPKNACLSPLLAA